MGWASRPGGHRCRPLWPCPDATECAQHTIRGITDSRVGGPDAEPSDRNARRSSRPAPSGSSACPS
eukprot:6186438-Pleurochrysis_carterae.AAC.3